MSLKDNYEQALKHIDCATNLLKDDEVKSSPIKLSIEKLAAARYSVNIVYKQIIGKQW